MSVAARSFNRSKTGTVAARALSIAHIALSHVTSNASYHYVTAVTVSLRFGSFFPRYFSTDYKKT